jgi:hypothetical protein
LFPEEPNNGIVVAQSGSSVKQLHNPITELVFSTALFPVIPAQTSPAIDFGKSSTLNSAAGSNDITHVITDFVVPVSQDNQYRPQVTYEPSGEYRMIDMIGDSGIRQIDINVSWKDKYGKAHPFMIAEGAWASIKIMFRRRDYYSLSLGL